MTTEQILAQLKAPIDFQAKIAKAAQNAVKEQETLNLIENNFRDGGYQVERPLTLKDGRVVTVLAQQLTLKHERFVRGIGQPDKPGTVRNPGVRQAKSPKRYPIWSGQ